MLVADNHNSIPLVRSHGTSSSQSNTQTLRSSKPSKSGQTSPTIPPSSSLFSQSPPQSSTEQTEQNKPGASSKPKTKTRSKSKQKPKSKSTSNSSPSPSSSPSSSSSSSSNSSSNLKQSSKSQHLQSQGSNQSKNNQQKSSKKNRDNTSNSTGANSNHDGVPNKIVIPPRSVDVVFNSNSSRNHKRAILKSTSDDLKQTTQDIKSLFLSTSEPLLPDGSKPVFNNTSNSSSNRKRSSKSVKSNNSNGYNNQRLPDGSEPDFSNKAVTLSKSSSSNNSSGRAKLRSSDSSNRCKLHSSSSYGSPLADNFKYAGSSFHAEPKAITLPKPSFLKSK